MSRKKSPLEIKGGVYCAQFIAGDQHIAFDFSDEHVDRLIQKVLAYLQAGAVFLPPPDQPDALQIEQAGQRLVFQPGAASQMARQRNERAYLLSLVVDQEYQRWSTRFVPLAGEIDVRHVIEGVPISFTEHILPAGVGGGKFAPTQRRLESIAEAMQSHQAFIILGEPGAGKTTTQQCIAYDAARFLLEGGQGRVPLFVRLSQQGGREPYVFLETEWERRTGTSFAEALAAGRILILADGINEIPRKKRNECLKEWMLFEQEYRGSNQLIFSGRENDYENQLNLPRVLVQPLDDSRIADFLERHNAEALTELLDDPAGQLRDMARNPLNLFVLVMVYLQGGKNLRALVNRGQLFQSFTYYLLKHEHDWHPDILDVEAKVDLLSALAYAMQQQSTGTTFDPAGAKKAIPDYVPVLGEQTPVDKDALLRFGRGASILDPATLPDVRFHHHLLQEYFAARELLRCFQAGDDLTNLWKTMNSVDELPEADVGEWDPLPEPPPTGWEVPTILACGLAGEPARFIEAVRQQNLALAGRCLDEAGIERPAELLADTRQELLADLYNPKIHLRARLQAGYILGRIGDPRFQPQEIHGVQVVLPQMVHVPGGKYKIGSLEEDPDAFNYEQPQFTVDLLDFFIGKWPVTNAEFVCFVQAGGYKEERYWQTSLARRWLKGEDVGGLRDAAYYYFWEQLQELIRNQDWRVKLEQTGNFSPQNFDAFEYIASLSDEDIKEEDSKARFFHQISQKSRTEPAYLDDPQYNNPSQPVVGITWFEANAYCVWLSEVTGRAYRLPTEVEWEAAARGLPSRKVSRVYSWGNDWNPSKANSLEGRVLKPSPVGAYTASGGIGPFEAEDQTGNVWNWTSSQYLHYPFGLAKCELPGTEGARVVRGGAWNYTRRFCRCAYRYGNVPGNFDCDVGFRLVSPSPDITGS